ncbi:MAG: 2-oxoglutarate ferredoxin oxidoreductase subunit beta [Candidatus Marinamargulisbacteria bacterium]|jgi:2-oxoglutarate ferredoxin oxidoreductase subunit beta
MTMKPNVDKLTMKDLKTEDPRWCTGCGDYSILVGLRKLMVQYQMDPVNTVNISGIGCSGRMPHYMNTYGFHTIHGRSIPITLGLALARPELNLFVHSGDGDSLSIGGNHLIHGISKNFNCVYLMYDNQIYGLTKNQTSPTSQKGLATMTQPSGGFLEPINPVTFALGLGVSFVASTAEWLPKHFLETLDLAFQHKGFSFIHIAQRCPKYNPDAWDFKNAGWMTFMKSENGIEPDAKALATASVVDHDPTNLKDAFENAENVPNRFGLFYRSEKATYDGVLLDSLKNTKKKDRSSVLDAFSI